MAPLGPSIQSYYKPTRNDTSSPSKIHNLSDGFTDDEINSALHPSPRKFKPDHEYEETFIAGLLPGPGAIHIVGRVVNFYEQDIKSKMPHAAKGFVRVIVKDDTGAVMVKLWYAHVDYNLRLGQLVSVFSPHISAQGPESGSAVAPMAVNIFPERDNSCAFEDHADDDGTRCRQPLGCVDGISPPDVMTLKTYLEGGHECNDSKILVCVKSIGARRKFTTAKGRLCDVMDVLVFDHTAEATLNLWYRLASSAAVWSASETVLLITNARLKDGPRPSISTSGNSFIDVNPDLKDADWLRRFAKKSAKAEHINPEFPEGAFNLEATLNSELRILFTIADIDDFVRSNPEEQFTGLINLMLLEINIMRYRRKTQFFCNECCNLKLYSNTLDTTCKQCESPVTLRLNPRIVGEVVDETGCIAPGKLVWSDLAWERLFGRTPEEMSRASDELLEYLEQRLAFLRLTLVFGWKSSVGRLCVLDVKM